MPPYLIHLVSVYLLIILAEQERNEDPGNNPEIEADRVDLKDVKFYKNIFNLVACIFNIINLIIFFAQSKFLKMAMFSRSWTYLDIIQLSTNIYVSLGYFIDHDLHTQRVIESLLTVTMTFKILYFLRLKGEIAPLIDIIGIILYEIRWFVVVFVIFQLASMCALYSIGRNQREVATEAGESDDIPYYSTYFGAFMFVYEASLGGYNTTWYKENKFSGFLVPFHILTSFIMTVYLLNMLVGLMGESFANNKENKEANKKIS